MYPHEFGPQHGGPATNTANPTAADFFAQQHDEDDSPETVTSVTFNGVFVPEQPPGNFTVDPGSIWQLPSDPMERIATALEAIAGGNRKAGPVITNHDDTLLFSLNQEIADRDEKLETLTQVVADIDEALGKSKAGPALAAKAVIEAWRNPKVDPGEVDGISDEEKDEIEKHLEPEGWEPPESLTAEQVLRLAAGETGAEVAPMEGRTTDGPPANDAPVEAWREYARSQGFAGPEIDKANRSQIRTALGVVQPVAPLAEA